MTIYCSEYDYPVYYRDEVGYDVREFYDEPYDDEDNYYGDAVSSYKD